MKAVEFIRKFGWKYTIDLLNRYPKHTHTTNDGRMFFNENTCVDEIKVQLIGLVKFSDLKKFTDAYELVQSVGGWNNATALYDEYLDSELGKAITLVEEVGECDE